MSNGPIWTEAEITLVTQMNERGKSAQQIAAALPGRSRNAVCGIITRMKSRPLKQTPRRPDLPMWERDASDRRLAIWERARQAAREALQGSQ